MCSMTPVMTRWPHPIRPWTWNRTRKTNPASTRIGGLTVGSWEITKLRLEAQIANLEAVIDQKDDDIMDLIDQVRALKAELDRREADSWRPHR